MSFRSALIPSAATAVVLALGLAACGGPEREAYDWIAMDSDFSAAVYKSPGKPPKVPADSAFKRLEGESRRLELIFSDYLPYSALSGIRGKAGDTVAIPAPELTEVLKAAEQAAFETEGAFDVTLHALKQAWGLSSGDQGRVPTDSALAAALRGNTTFGSAPGDHPALFPPFKVLPGQRLVLLRDSVSFDLGGIAKGYAVDRMHALLDTLGWTVHLVKAGGDMRVGGMKAGGPWRIGIRHPRGAADSIAGLLRVETSRAVSTSGDYERYFLEGGKRYHHIFDPRTGRPAGPWCSITVLAKESLWADALTEPLFVLGPERGLGLLSRFGAEAVWIRESGAGLCHVASAGLQGGKLTLEGIPACESGG